MYRHKRIAVKVGSNVLTKENGKLDLVIMESLVNQIAKLKEDGIEIVLISSGAVAAGRSIYDLDEKLDPVLGRQIASSIGQVHLINHYDNLFSKHSIRCGQILTTKENFSSRRHYLNQKRCISAIIDNGILPIVNENDTISVSELMFTDNDELSGLIASMMDMDALIILSNVDGIYDGCPSDPASKVISEIGSHTDIADCIQTTKSTFGRGGMHTKYRIAANIAKEGIDVIIANGKKENILTEIIKAGPTVTHTHFHAKLKSESNIKKWLSHSKDFTRGEVHLNQGATEALLGEQITSLLFIGVAKITGNFIKNEMVKIIDHEGKMIGIGKARVGHDRAARLAGKKGIKPFIHYDYLHLY